MFSYFVFIQCSFERRVSQFAKYGRIADILTYLRQVLGTFVMAETLFLIRLSGLLATPMLLHPVS